jgi:hypothetical protein
MNEAQSENAPVSRRQFGFGGPTPSGLVLWCAGSVAIAIAFRSSFHEGSDASAVFGWLGLVCVAASVLAFLVAAVKRRKGQAANCGGCVLALFTLIIPATAANTIHRSLWRQDDIQETTRTLVTVHKLAQDIDSIRARLGRLPKDERELVRLRGKPMPLFGSGHHPISYYRVSDSDYLLNFSFRSFWGYHWDLLGYVASYHGPNVTPRLFVDLF